MAALGKHLLLELNDCNRDLLDNVDYIRDSLVEIAKQIGATVMDSSFHHFSPQGVSGVVIIAESHISIHTWPEYNYAAIDVFTCGNAIEPKNAVKPLVEKMRARYSSFIEVKRGILSESVVKTS